MYQTDLPLKLANPPIFDGIDFYEDARDILVELILPGEDILCCASTLFFLDDAQE
jgi:hypothetical protein